MMMWIRENKEREKYRLIDGLPARNKTLIDSRDGDGFGFGRPNLALLGHATICG